MAGALREMMGCLEPETDTPLKSGAPVLELREVTKVFRSGGRETRALDRVSLRVSQGLVTGLIGPDGAGKTTLMRLCAGLLSPDSGQVMVLGLDATADSLAVQASIGYMPQRFGLYEDLTVQENLDLYADLQGVAGKDRPPRYLRLMQMTGLSPFTSRLAGQLSGGMKQKLGLACTLVRPPRLLLLDEPTVGVDPVSRRELWSIVYRLVKEEGMSVLLSTAYLDEAERCREVIVIHRGGLLGHASPQEFSFRVKGRTYAVSAPGLKKRSVQEQLSGKEGVRDAVIVGDRIRLVVDPEVPPRLESLLLESEGVLLEPVSPRFEDGFIDLLREQKEKKAGRRDIQNTSVGRRREGKDEGHAIEVRGLERRFGSFYAVKGVSFHVRRSEVFGLLGANGAGKSTTFRMLCGLLPPSGGSLSVAGVDLRRAPAAARRRIGYMSQRFSLYGTLSVRQNMSFFSLAYGLRGHERLERIRLFMNEFELDPLADAVSGDLPLGYKQRLSLACALMHEPEILFLDEPTSGVDPLARREFWHLIGMLAERGVTVLVTTHFMEEAEYCDRLAIMSAGEILALGTPSDIKSEARSPELPNPTMEDAFIKLIERDSGG